MKTLTLNIFVFLISLFITNFSEAQWVQIYGPIGYNFRCFAINGSNIFAGNYNQGVFLSTDNGDTWTPINNGLSTDVMSLTLNGGYLFAGTNNNGIYRTDNSGISWTQLNTGESTFNALLGSDAYLFAGENGQGVFVSTNNGTSWAPANNGLTNTFIYALASSPNAGGGMNLFAGTGNDGIFRSTNFGNDWTAGNGIVNLWTWCLAAAQDGSGNIFAGTDGGVFISSDNGSNWNVVNNGLTKIVVYAMVTKGSNIFAGTKFGGIFLSTNNGVNWTSINSDFSDHVLSLGVNDDYLFAGIAGGGRIFRRPLSEILTSLEPIFNGLPSEFKLEQNFPNPFNSSCAIKYSIPKSSQVTLKIYNTLGEEIEILVNEEKPIGTYELTWNAANLPSGVYFYRLQTGSFVQIKKMILLK